MKKILIIWFITLYILLLTGCTGYNNILYDHLSDEKNYLQVTGKIHEIYYYKNSVKKTWQVSSDFKLDVESTIFVSLQFDKETYLKFSGTSSMSDDFDYTTNYIDFELIQLNTNILIDNSFFESISYGDDLTIKASNLIYMDTTYFVAIQLIHDDLVYLATDDGLSNFIVYMNENRSLF